MKTFRKSIYGTEQVFIRNWLIKKRHKKKLTQRALAEQLQVVHSLIGKVEKGERRLDVLEFITYCKEVNADPCELIQLLQKLDTTTF